MEDFKKKKDQTAFETFGIPYDGGQMTAPEPPYVGKLEWSWQTLHQSEPLLDSLPLGFCLVVQGEIVFANHGLAEKFGSTKPTALVERQFLDLIGPEDRQSVSDRLRTALATRGSSTVSEAVLVRPDGTQAPAHMAIRAISFEGRPAALVSVTLLGRFLPIGQWPDGSGTAESAQQDAGEDESEVRLLLDRIDELSQERDEMERKGELLRAMVNDAHDLIFSKDMNLRYTFVNPAMEKLHRRSASEILGTLAAELMPGEAAKRVRAVDSRVLAGETVEEIYTTPINETPLTFHGIRIPLRNRDGKVVGLFGIVRNITETNQAPDPSLTSTKRTFPSKAMKEALFQAQSIAASDGTVLLLGESGSGKDYLARWIHEHSRRSDGRFFAVNCAAVSGELADSELFGHEAGAFTGARTAKKGLLQLAEGGTLLLNEIGEFSLPLQAKLLTFLDTKSFLKVGGEHLVNVNVRIMAATHRMLMKEVAEGRFLSALFYRLNVLRIDVPPLRDRVEDIPIIAGEIVGRLAKEMQLQKVPELDAHSLAALANYHWPGNVRELRNVLERAIMLWKGGSLHIDPSFLETTPEVWSHSVNFDADRSLPEVLGNVAKAICAESLRRCNGNKTEAARLLGISRGALYRSMRKGELPRDFGT
jgi:PAS domain S-box-containing protein